MTEMPPAWEQPKSSEKKHTLIGIRDLLNIAVTQNNPKEGERVHNLYYTNVAEFADYARALADNDDWWNNSIPDFQMIPGQSIRQNKDAMRTKLREFLELLDK